MIYGQHHRFGGLDMYYRTRLTMKGNEYKLGYLYVEPETKNDEKLP